ncbi:phosphatidate cytidylyltransferase [Mammaliicoccus sciuri]|uniref:phosphatidate cytidylyltransferase n=1 Tax=Mammaliicoccus sciuri TaxID=1296 RepID=UPI003F552CA6
MKTRTISAIVAMAVFLPVVIYGGLPVIALAYLLAIIALKEILNMNNLSIISIPGFLSVVSLCIILLPQELINKDISVQLRLLIVMSFLMLSYTVMSKNRFNFMDASFCVMSVTYIGIGFMYFYETREHGLQFILFALLLVWLTDTGAYIFGRLFGKHKLWPLISPNKTIEGFIGGIFSSLIVAVIFGQYFDMDVSLWLLIPLTMLLSMFGQLGDLVESGLKRHFGVKDSGNIMPGHGGILDRFDSFIFVLPLLNLFLFQL